MKIHWRTTEAFSWPSGGKRNPRMRTFLLAGNIVCQADRGGWTTIQADVTCRTCLNRITVGRVDTPATIACVLARGES